MIIYDMYTRKNFGRAAHLATAITLPYTRRINSCVFRAAFARFSRTHYPIAEESFTAERDAAFALLLAAYFTARHGRFSPGVRTSGVIINVFILHVNYFRKNKKTTKKSSRMNTFFHRYIA